MRLRAFEPGHVLMRRTVAIANGKGGVGKTSLTDGLGGLIAAGGYRVLTMDADPQGNLRRDLGYPDSGGRALADAIKLGTTLEPVRDVRDNLDAVPGGAALEELVCSGTGVDTLGDAAPVYESSIRYLESAAIDMRRHGLLPHELEHSQLREKARRIERLARGVKASGADDLLSRDASGIAGDYHSLAREVLGAIAEREADSPATDAVGAR